MTFPSFISVTNGNEATNRTSFSVPVPATISGDRLVVTICHGDATDQGGAAPAGGWAKRSGTIAGVSVYELVNCPTAASGNVTFTQNVNNWWASQCFLIRGSHLSDALEISTVSNANANASPNPNSLTPAGGAKDWFWIADIVFGLAGFSTQPTVSSYPTNYTGTTISTTSSGFGQVAVASGYRTLNASSEDPGTFTLSNANANWFALTLAIPPAAAIVSSPPMNNRNVHRFNRRRFR